jgi:two-component sensor histidine kinase
VFDLVSLQDGVIWYDLREQRTQSGDVHCRWQTVSSREAVSIGLIVTEGVINALKHAFPVNKKDGHIVVAYKADGMDWKLSIATTASVDRTRQASKPAWEPVS